MDFPPYPAGVDASAVVGVIPHEGRDALAGQAARSGLVQYVWFLYRSSGA